MGASRQHCAASGTLFMSEAVFTIHDSMEKVASLEGAWRELHQHCTYRSIYNGFDFFIASVKAFTTHEVSLFVLSESLDGEVIAIFPLQMSITTFAGLNLKQIDYAAQWEIDKPYPLIRCGRDAEAWDGLFRFLSSNRVTWHWFELMEIREGLSGVSELASRFRLPWYWVRKGEDRRSPVIVLSDSWEDRWNAHRKMRKKVCRIEKDFGDRLRFEVIDGHDRWAELLDMYVDIESRGWKAGRIGIGKSAQVLAFYRDLFERLARRGQMAFGVLSVDSRPIAIEIAYMDAGIVYFSHGTFDEDFGDYSPGMVSTALFLRHFHRAGYKEGDFLAGYAGYVVPWCDKIVGSDSLIVLRSSIPVLYVLAVKVLHKLIPPRLRKQPTKPKTPVL